MIFSLKIIPVAFPDGLCAEEQYNGTVALQLYRNIVVPPCWDSRPYCGSELLVYRCQWTRHPGRPRTPSGQGGRAHSSQSDLSETPLGRCSCLGGGAKEGGIRVEEAMGMGQWGRGQWKRSWWRLKGSDEDLPSRVLNSIFSSGSTSFLKHSISWLSTYWYIDNVCTDLIWTLILCFFLDFLHHVFFFFLFAGDFSSHLKNTHTSPVSSTQPGALTEGSYGC